MNDDLYVDIHKEMEAKNQTFSQVVVRRLSKLASIELMQTAEPLSMRIKE